MLRNWKLVSFAILAFATFGKNDVSALENSVSMQDMDIDTVIECNVNRRSFCSIYTAGAVSRCEKVLFKIPSNQLIVILALASQIIAIFIRWKDNSRISVSTK